MKRIISILLIMTITLSAVFSVGGCSSKKQSKLTLGEWLVMVNSSFGMDSYSSQEPYFASVPESNIYFDAVQIAAEWDVVDKTHDINVNKSLTWCDALMTLVNASVFRASYMTADEKLDYALANFDCPLKREQVNNIIEPYAAITLLAQVHKKWAERTYDTPIEEIKYAENVKEYDEITEYEIEDNTVVLSEDSAVDIKAGDIYVLGGTEDDPGIKVFKAENVTVQDGNIYIENSEEEPDITEVVEDLLVQETIIPTEANTVVHDAYGNVIGGDSSSMIGQRVQNTGWLNASRLGTSGAAYVEQVLKYDKSSTIKYGDYEIELGYGFDSNFKMKASIKHTKTNMKYEFEISDLTATPEIDIGFFKINSAALRVDYKTKSTFSVDPEKAKPIDLVAAPYDNRNGKGMTNIYDAIVKKSNDAGGKGAQTVKIGEIQLAGIGVARVCLDVRLNITIDGKISIVITSNNSQGVEYKNGNIRYINERTQDADVNVEVKTEATISLGIALYTIGLKERLIGADLIGGLGFKVKGIWHLVDGEHHLIDTMSLSDYSPGLDDSILSLPIVTDVQTIEDIAKVQGGIYTSSESEIHLNIEACLDIVAYGILKIKLSGESKISKLLSVSTKWEFTFWDDKNASFYHAHVEDFNFPEGFANAAWGSDAYKLDLCTKKFKPFDGSEEAESTTVDSNGNTILIGKYISLSKLGVSLSEGEHYTIVVDTLPQGYSLSDLKYMIDDTSVATVDSNGVITAVSEGSTMLTVYIEGTGYSAYCAIMIMKPNAETLSPWM